MTKDQLIKKWETKYDYYIKKADKLQDELAELDILKDWKEYQPKSIKMNDLYLLCVFISDFINSF